MIDKSKIYDWDGVPVRYCKGGKAEDGTDSYIEVYRGDGKWSPCSYNLASLAYASPVEGDRLKRLMESFDSK